MTGDIAAWFGGRSRVLFVHAHPDDESITTGGTLAALAAAGREPLLVTLTRGERGEVAPGPFSALQGTPGLAPHRETELGAARAMLGLGAHAFLGAPPARAGGLDPRSYEDSGMEWADPEQTRAIAASDAPETALTRAPAVEALNDLLALAVAWGATGLVSYDERGGYGHPDHVFAHRAARAVALGLDLPFWEIEVREDPDPGTADADEVESGERETHDVSEWLDRKIAALRAHGTQLMVEGADIVHVGGQRQAIATTEVFRRIRVG